MAPRWLGAQPSFATALFPWREQVIVWCHVNDAVAGTNSIPYRHFSYPVITSLICCTTVLSETDTLIWTLWIPHQTITGNRICCTTVLSETDTLIWTLWIPHQTITGNVMHSWRLHDMPLQAVTCHFFVEAFTFISQVISHCICSMYHVLTCSRTCVVCRVHMYFMSPTFWYWCHLQHLSYFSFTRNSITVHWQTNVTDNHIFTAHYRNTN